MHTVTTPGAAQSTAIATGAVARVAVAGATGYTGQELIRLLARHPAVRLTLATSSGGASSGRRLPALARLWDGAITPLEPGILKREADLVFLALPDMAARDRSHPGRRGRSCHHLSGASVCATNRCAHAGIREQPLQWTGVWATRARARGHTERAAGGKSGLYPNRGASALAPLAAAGLLVPGVDVIVDAKSGVSGAGKTPSERTHFSECYGSLSAYGVFAHRHGAEIEQGLGRSVTFTPHLVPLDRGILETIYIRVPPGTTEEALGDIYQRAYSDEPFVRLVGAALPEIKHVAHTNFCDIGWRVDPSGRV